MQENRFPEVRSTPLSRRKNGSVRFPVLAGIQISNQKTTAETFRENPIARFTHLSQDIIAQNHSTPCLKPALPDSLSTSKSQQERSVR